MIARVVNQAADVIHRAQVNGAQTAAGLAIALESARLLVSDEMVHEMAALEAERDGLLARVAELEAQREADHNTWQHDLRTARGEREAAAVRIAALEGEHYASVHHDYRLGHDLPETGGAR